MHHCIITHRLRLLLDKHQQTNITPYMHMMAYHAPAMTRKYGNLKQFSGQGYVYVTWTHHNCLYKCVENNDDAKHY